MSAYAPGDRVRITIDATVTEVCRHGDGNGDDLRFEYEAPSGETWPGDIWADAPGVTVARVDITVIDYSIETGPYWYVVVDDTPVLPENPLPLEHAIKAFRREVAEAEPGDVVELQQCTPEDLKWAGISSPDDAEETDR